MAVRAGDGTRHGLLPGHHCPRMLYRSHRDFMWQRGSFADAKATTYKSIFQADHPLVPPSVGCHALPSTHLGGTTRAQQSRRDRSTPKGYKDRSPQARATKADMTSAHRYGPMSMAAWMSWVLNLVVEWWLLGRSVPEHGRV